MALNLEYPFKLGTATAFYLAIANDMSKAESKEIDGTIPVFDEKDSLDPLSETSLTMYYTNRK